MDERTQWTQRAIAIVAAQTRDQSDDVVRHSLEDTESDLPLQAMKLVIGMENVARILLYLLEMASGQPRSVILEDVARLAETWSD
jgi:hypothetical protein